MPSIHSKAGSWVLEFPRRYPALKELTNPVEGTEEQATRNRREVVLNVVILIVAALVAFITGVLIEVLSVVKSGVRVLTMLLVTAMG